MGNFLDERGASNFLIYSSLLTGACGGIGKETVYLFAEREADLVLVDINGAGLEQVAEQCKARGAGEVDFALNHRRHFII